MARSTVLIRPGTRYGRLTITSKVVKTRPGGHDHWLCLCDCGNETSVSSTRLRLGFTRSCGCFARENTAILNTKHGGYYTPEYKVWSGMKERCLKPTSVNFKHYGGRGITICQRWCDSFEHFLTDMGPRPSADHSIDRFPDNNGNYEPGNCRWATRQEQGRNRRTNTLVTFQGQTQSIKQWCEDLGADYERVVRRVSDGMSFSDAISTPKLREKRTTHCFHGHELVNNTNSKGNCKTCRKLAVDKYNAKRSGPPNLR